MGEAYQLNNLIADVYQTITLLLYIVQSVVGAVMLVLTYRSLNRPRSLYVLGGMALCGGLLGLIHSVVAWYYTGNTGVWIRAVDIDVATIWTVVLSWFNFWLSRGGVG